MKELEEILEEKIKAAIEKEDSEKDLPAVDYPIDRPLGKYCDHTVLRAYTPKEIVRRFCREAIEYGAAGMCVNPGQIKTAYEVLKGSDVNLSAAIGFPLGATTPAVKAFEAKEAVENGANEVDMVINIGALRDKDYSFVFNDIKGVVDAVSDKAIVKVIIETCYLTRDEKIAACVIAAEAGASYVKTSTGFGTAGAKEEDVRMMKRVVGDRVKVKASTDITRQEHVITMAKAGAERMGISKLVQIVTGDNSLKSAGNDNQPPKFD